MYSLFVCFFKWFCSFYSKVSDWCNYEILVKQGSIWLFVHLSRNKLLFPGLEQNGWQIIPISLNLQWLVSSIWVQKVFGNKNKPNISHSTIKMPPEIPALLKNEFKLVCNETRLFLTFPTTLTWIYFNIHWFFDLWHFKSFFHKSCRKKIRLMKDLFCLII